MATSIPVLVVRRDGTCAPIGPARQRRQQQQQGEAEAGPEHRVFVLRDHHAPSTTTSASCTGCCVVRIASSTGESHEIQYHHDAHDARIDPDPMDVEGPAAATTTIGDGSPRSWHAALALLARAKAEGAEVRITLRGGECEGGDGFVVGLLSAHALVHNACRKGLKHAIPSIQTALRQARLHEARQRRPSALLADVPNPGRPQPRVMAFAGWAVVLSEWQTRHVQRVWGAGSGWRDGVEEEEEEGDEGSDDDGDGDGDRSNRFVVYVGDRFAAESREFIVHAGITHVVNCGIAHGVENAFAHEPHMRYITLVSDDMDPRAPYPGDQWDMIMDFLRDAKRQGARTLVHCMAGINRSVSTLAIYLVLEGAAESIEEAIALIKERRPVASPAMRYVKFAEKYVERVRQFGCGGQGGAGGVARLAPRGEEEEEDEEDEEQGRRYRKKRDKPKRK